MKRSAALRALSSEHHTGLVLARRAAVTVRVDEVAAAWKELAQRFVTELEPHFQREETQLLPALARLGQTALVERTLEEHGQLRALVYEQPRDITTLHAFAELLQQHIRFEERELFTTAQMLLPEFSLEMDD